MADSHPTDAEIIEAAVAAKARAIAPYSNFRVGSALVAGDGRVYTGGNIESSSYGLTLCSERVTIYKALSEGEREFSRLAIASDTEAFCSPCGACRQVLWDFAPDLKIILINREQQVEALTLRDLLPHAFDDTMFGDDQAS